MTKLLAVVVTLAIACAHVPAPAFAQGADVQDIADPSDFTQALEPYGHWVDHPRYGQVWLPDAQQDRDWRPYSRGQWVYTEENGWYWQSEEEFGWAVYHYGRWRLDNEFGWIWVPGTEWGPAWVAWRQGDDTVGWSPLPPEADWDADAGISAYASTVYESPRYAAAWCFVPVALIAAPYVWRHFEPRSRSIFWIDRTRHIDGTRAINRRAFNRGIDRQTVERFARTPVPVMRIREVQTARDSRSTRDGFVGAYRPHFAGNADRTRARPDVRPDDRRFAVRPPVSGLPGRIDQPHRDFDGRREVQPRRDFGSPARPDFQPRREAREDPRVFQPQPRMFEPRREARPEPPREFRRPEPPRQFQRPEPPREFRREARPQPPPQMQRQAPQQAQPRQGPPPQAQQRDRPQGQQQHKDRPQDDQRRGRG